MRDWGLSEERAEEVTFMGEQPGWLVLMTCVAVPVAEQSPYRYRPRAEGHKKERKKGCVPRQGGKPTWLNR